MFRQVHWSGTFCRSCSPLYRKLIKNGGKYWTMDSGAPGTNTKNVNSWISIGGLWNVRQICYIKMLHENVTAADSYIELQYIITTLVHESCFFDCSM
jgi:hypothetical protein